MVSILIFTENLHEAYAHYREAFGATILGEGYGDEGELIHLEMEILGNRIALAPRAAGEIFRGNVIAICLKFQSQEKLLKAFDTLKAGGQTDGLKDYPWSPLEGYVTDRYGAVWCIGT